MKQRRNTLQCFMVLVGVGCIQAFAEPFAKGPYLGQTPPGPVAQVFAPGLISDTRPQAWESHGTFSIDGNTFCYLRCPIRNSRRVGDIFITENTKQGWTVPKRIESIRESESSAWSPCLSPDANSIYFTIGGLKSASKRNIYRCDRTPHGWGAPQVLGPPLSSPTPEVTCSIAANNSIYFGSNRNEAPFEKSIIWAAPFVDNTWPQATYISFNQIQEGRPADPGIAPDESFMVFTVRKEPGPSWDRDIYLTLRLPDGTWSKPRNLGPRINTAYIEHSPRISPDKKYLFFTRSNGWDPRKYSADIYWVELKEYLADPNINQTDSEFGITGSSAEPFAKGPYLGQTPPGPVAQVFAPGLISDTRPQTWEAFGTFSADGNTFCFHRVEGVFISENTNQGWTRPKCIDIIRKYHPSAWSPCLSADANSIYFTRGMLKPVSGRNLYRCHRTAGRWDKPQSLGPPLSSPSPEITCSVAANSNLYFGSGRTRPPGSIPENIIWAAPFLGNTWPRAEYVTLDHPQAGDPGIAPDESFMVFTAKDLPGGHGERDIYLTLRLPDGTWSKPRNLGPRINSNYIEHSPRISPDKKYLFFTRSNGWDPRKYGADIYWVELEEYLPESYR